MDECYDCTMIIRNIFAEMVEVLDEFPVVALIGPRQCGKTTLARHAAEVRGLKSIYLDLELSSDLAKLKNAELFLKSHEDKLIIIDEIHHAPNLFALIRALVDQKRTNGRFLILGSASPSLLQQSVESLTGRIYYFELSPFSLREILEEKSMSDHWFRGGYPGSLLAGKPEASRRWLNAYIRNYTSRDLRDLGLKVSPLLIDRFWRILASYHGQIWNASRIASVMGLTANTINRYLFFLKEAFLVHELQPLEGNFLKRLVRSPKIYIRDSGILHQLIHIQDFDALHGDGRIGASWEGYVIEQIHLALGQRYDLHYYRTHNGAECDLVLSLNGAPEIAIEIKYSLQPSVTKGFFETISDLQTTRNFVVVPTGDPYPIRDGVVVIGLKEFLAEISV